MPSNYKKLGPYIREVNIRNTDLRVTTLLGVSIKKVLMPSIANTIGTNMSTYKIIKRNQFAYGPVTSRNGDKISIALLQEHEEAIVSQAYVPFEIIDHNELDPEYLMMWFRRPEFDRYARFKSHGSARETFDWAEMCDTELPIPHIDVQRAMVKEYNTITDRIALNEQLNQKLEETAQTLYHQWFVDFEFPFDFEKGEPSLKGKPYKSNGGEMEWCEELEKEIPKGWEAGDLEELAAITHGYAFLGEFISKEENDCVLVTPGNVKIGGGFKSDSLRYYSGSVPESYIFQQGDMIVTMTDLSKEADTLGYPAIIPQSGKSYLHNQRIGKIVLRKEAYFSSYLYWTMCTKDYRNHVVGGATGTTVKHTSPTRILEYKFPFCTDNDLIKMFDQIGGKLLTRMKLSSAEWHGLESLKSLLHSKMSTVEVGVGGGVGVG